MKRLWPHEVDALAVRQERRIVVLEAEQYDPGFPPSGLLEFAAWFEGVMAQIPEQHRARATIELDSVSSYYDSHYAKIEVVYRRPETDEEWEARKVDVMSRKQQEDRDKEERERQEYLRLRHKFESTR